MRTWGGAPSEWANIMGTKIFFLGLYLVVGTQKNQIAQKHYKRSDTLAESTAPKVHQLNYRS